ncbi:Ig-like domain-containing protein [Seonamhaeicola sp.]|uniref:Ig-like domain-containing protein n=1 Tax=Seonamhaeicola sp. TaxID=1912245 RepID=UPI00262BB6F3|nr:Ig-like domain-containing protein [Seonamhaeicola sp.]
MKSIKFLTLFFLTTILFVGCFEDDSVSLVEPNHRVIVTSEMNFDNTINPGGHIDFGDLSRGVQSRTWSFPEDLSAARIAGEDGNTSPKDVIKGLFYKPGIYNINLNQTFKGDVYPNEDSQSPIAGRELDTTIVVTVLDWVESNIQAYYINEDGSTGDALNMSNNAENELTASKYVRLTYSAIGEPQEIVWSSAGGKPTSLETSDGAEVDMRFSKLGTWDLQYIASRARPTDADTIFIENFIKVIPSTEPVTLDRVFEKEYQTKIGLEFSREMNPETVNKNNFSVTIETAGGAVLNPEIASVLVDSEEGNVLVIELANELMYNDDTVKVSYTPGLLSTLDAVASTAITDAVLTDFIKTNVLESTDVDYSFETSEDSNWPYLWWGGQWGEYDYNVSFDRARTGDKSMYIEFRPNGGMIMGHRDAGGNNITFPVESGANYEMGAWIYVEDLGNITGEANIRMYWTPGTNWGIGDNVTFTPATPVGQWFYSSAVVQFAASGDVSYMIRGINTNTERLKFYMDDITVYKLTSRP